LKESIKEDFLNKIIENKRLYPSYFLNELISQCSSKEIEQLLKTTARIYYLSRTFITNSVCLFIDAFDQTLADKFVINEKNRNIEIWKNGQLGLLKASHKIHVHNQHIKIYSSIRQEAFSGFVDADRSVIKGKSAILEYSKKDLKDILENAISKYTIHKNIKDFIGYEQITNRFINEKEDIFEYIYRHSIYTPRSIMKFGKAIDETTAKDEDSLMKLINNKGSEQLVEDYLYSEKLIFLDFLSTKDHLISFLELIPSNVLHSKSLSSIKNLFAAQKGYFAEDCHPFCELYNIGLLGQVKTNNIDPTSKKQKFIKPHQFNWTKNHILHSNNNDKNIYLVHPSLFDLIEKNRGNDYRINKKNIVGDEKDWNDWKHFPTIFLSHSSKDKPIIEKNFYNAFEDIMNLKIPVNIWFDKKNILTGDGLQDGVERGLRDTDILIYIISKNSLATDWVANEVNSKMQNEINDKKVYVLGIIIDDTATYDLPTLLQNKKIEKLEDNNWNKLINKLAEDIYMHLKNNNTI
jgi:hypothetical protein